jgi:hypothetical protein
VFSEVGAPIANSGTSRTSAFGTGLFR